MKPIALQNTSLSQFAASAPSSVASSAAMPARPAAAGRRWSLWLRAIAGAALVAYLLLSTEWPPVLASIQGLVWTHWMAALGIYLASQVASAWRWAELARPLGFGYSRFRYLILYFEGMFFNLCLPSSIGGDVLKAYWLAPDSAGRMLAGCTVLADRVAGVVALGVIGLTALAGRTLGLELLMCLLVGIVLMAAAQASVTLGLWGWKWLAEQLPPNSRPAKVASRLLPYHERPNYFRRAVGWGLLVQALNVLTVVEIGQAMGLRLVDVPIVAYCVAVPVVALLTILPISISGVGVREQGMAWMLASYGVKAEMGVTLGLLWFSVTIASGLVGGLVYLFGFKRPHELAKPGTVPTFELSSDSIPPVPQSLLVPVVDPFSIDDCTPLAVSPQIREKIAGWTLSIVVPIYNEIENLDRLHQAVGRVMDALGRPYELLLVDDGSSDGSSARLDELAAADRRMKVVHFRRNFGQTAAMSAGIQLATGQVIIMLDADLQNDPADIPAMLDKLADGYDLVHGWRKDRQDPLWTRRVPSQLANRLIAGVTGFPVHDLGCTLKVIRREIAQELQLYGEMHRFIPILAHWNGARCAEMVTRHHPRRFGTSKYGLSRTIRVVLDLITVKYMIQYLTSPMKLFGTIGLASGLVSFASGVATVMMRFDGLGGLHMIRNPLLLLTVFAGFVSLQFFVLGMLGELGVRTYYESQNKRPYTIRRLVNFDSPPNAAAEPAVDPQQSQPPTRRAA